jgi:pseudomonalisin
MHRCNAGAIRTRHRASALSWVLAASLIFLPATHGAGAELIAGPVDAARLHTLSQQRAAWATRANDLGAVADDLPLAHLTVVLRRSPERQLAFERLLAQQQDPNSPDFHHWLTPVEVGEQFGASAHDIDALTQWLQAQGLQVDAVANSRIRIDFSGSAASIGAAFATRLHAYLVNGEQRIAPVDAPQIPAALAAIVQSVSGLATIKDRPHHRVGATQLFPQSIATDNPASTQCTGGPCVHFLWPADFAAIYDLNPVYQQGINGSGQTIAIIGRARVYLPDVENFQRLAGQAIKDPVIIVPPGGVDPGPALSSGGSPSPDQIEATIDVMRATTVAPGATIDLVISASSDTSFGGVELASQYVVDTSPPLAQIMSISFGDCEANAGQAGVDFYDSVFSQAAAEGISVFVSSGDTGVAGCDGSYSVPPPSQITSASYICASSYATCVGGTEFADTANPNAYWSPGNSGVFGSALGYIPEGAWNEPLDDSGKPQAAASGGGVSVFMPTPPWQTGPGVPGTQGRYTPDVSFSASSHDGYAGCIAAQGASCVRDNSGHFHFVVFSGTSESTPAMAGIAALLNQKTGSAQGNLNPRLYALAATSGNGVFHDVTVSTSGVAGCDVAVPSMCNNSTPGPTGLSGGLPGYLVGPGYDEATGLGSIDVANLLQRWPGSPNGGNYEGLWWAAPAGSESGWGINLAHQGDIIFATWFTYDLSGKFWWLSMTATQNSGSTFSGALYQTRGPAFNAVPFNPAAVTQTQVGTGTLTFSDINNATFSYTVNGISQIKAITRQVFGTLPTCVWGAQANLALATNVSGLWWAAPAGIEAGWGINFSQQNNIIFATWFTYNSDGTPLWLSVTAYSTAPGVYSGALYLTNGPAFDAVPFLPADVSRTQVGTATFTFADGNDGTFAYTVNLGMGAVSQMKAITQQVFRPPGTACQ